MFSLRRPFLASAPLSARLLSTAVGRDVKPFSEMPSPKGELPILGHLYEMKKKGDIMFSKVFDEFFKELGPIYKLNFPGMLILFAADQCYSMRYRDHKYCKSSLILLQPCTCITLCITLSAGTGSCLLQYS